MNVEKMMMSKNQFKFLGYWIRWIRSLCGHTLARFLRSAFVASTPHLLHPCNIVACPPGGHTLARRLRVACALLVASTLRPDIVCTFRMSLGCRCNRESFAGVGGGGGAGPEPPPCTVTVRPANNFYFFPNSATLVAPLAILYLSRYSV